MGTGHVMRCLTLAEALRERGAAVAFISRAHEGALIPLVRARGFATTELPPPPAGRWAADGDYAAWLGVTQEADAQETMRALGGRCDWLVVDHYGLDANWEKRLRGHAGRLLAISDLPQAAHDCDLLLNANYGAKAADGTAGAVGRRLDGARYALLRPEFRRRSADVAARSGPVRRAFVFFGGTDPANLTGRTLEALSAPALAGVEADVVVGANHPQAGALAARAAARPGTRIHRQVEDMAALMAGCDLAIGAGGATTLERLCLGLPGIAVSIAENQVPGCEALARDGLIVYLGREAGATADAIAEAMTRLCADGEARAALSLRGRLAVDGLGAARVVEAMLPTAAAGLRLRPASAGDAMLYFAWVNDPEVRRQSLNRAPIAWPEHRRWFEARLAAGTSRLFVLEAGGLPVGQLRFDAGEGGELSIDYSIDPAFRGRGWGRRLLELGLERAAGAPAFRAEVRPGNPASLAVFRALGFAERPGPADGGVVVFRRSA